MMRWPWLLLALVVSSANAGRPMTFAWDNDPNWPPGTTVELCGNGDVCLTGLTGTQATLDLPADPGETIQVRARAVAPAGHQCGDPPVPCPHSGWATFEKTVSAVPVGIWARKFIEVAPMAVERTGTYTIIHTARAQTGSQSVTIPADTNLLVVAISAWKGSANWYPASPVTWDGSNLSKIVATDGQSSFQQGWAGRLANPTTGAKTLAWDFGTSYNEGAHIVVVAYKGVDTSDPIVSSASVTTNNTDVTSGLSAGASDMMVGVASIYSGSSPSGADNGQTQIVASARESNDIIIVAEKQAATAFYWTAGFPSDTTALAFVLRAAAAGTASFIPPAFGYAALLVR